jgi:outer membrane receptor protein involved in Fe transport
MKKELLLACLLLGWATTGAIAQGSQARITGRVLDSVRAAVPFAVVKLLQSGDSLFIKGSIADEQGGFSVPDVPAGTYLLKVSALGYATVTGAPFEVAAGETKVLDPVALPPAEARVLQEVVVTGRKPLVEQLTDMTVVNVAGTIMAEGSNALEILRLAPGVVVDQNDRISMNGKPGVVIYVDGKPTQLPAQELGNLLKTIQADAIDKIEVITNPSARYDAQGNAGILNIRLKKDKSMGTNGNFNLRFQRDIHSVWNSSVSLNHRAKSYHVYGSVGGSVGKYQTDDRINRYVNGSAGEVRFDQNSRRIENWRSPNFRAGADVFLGRKSTLGFLTTGFYSNNEGSNFSRILFSNGGPGSDSSLLAFNALPENRRWNTYNLNYQYLDSTGIEINLNTDYSLFASTTENNLTNNFFNREEQAYRTNTNLFTTRNRIGIYTLKGDFIKTFPSKAKFETGFKTYFVDTDNDFRGVSNYDTYREQANRFNYNENVAAAYASYAFKLNKFGFQAGLRVENTRVKGISRDVSENRINNPDSSYTNLFPSAFFTYDLAPNHLLKLAYGRRINRPSFQDMNPFEYFVDQYTSERGNPYLKPQYVNNYEITYAYMEGATLTFSYAKTNDFFSLITHQTGSQVYLTTENIGSFGNMNINLNLPVPIAKWWFCYTWLGAFRNTFAGSLPEGPLDVTQWGFHGYMNHNFTINKTWGAEISGVYDAPTKKVIFNDAASGSLNVGVRMRLLNGKSYLKVGYNDLLKTQRWRSNVNFGNMRFDVLRTWESQQLTVNFSYRFGGADVKGARNRSFAGEDEQGRIKQGK